MTLKGKGVTELKDFQDKLLLKIKNTKQWRNQNLNNITNKSQNWTSEIDMCLFP